MKPLFLICVLLCITSGTRAQAVKEISATDYPTIQAALDANPGRMVYLPAGDHPTSDVIRIRHAGSGLFGPGRIIQIQPQRSAILIEETTHVQLRDLTITRKPGLPPSRDSAILILNSSHVSLDNVRLFNSPADGDGGVIGLRNSTACSVRNCVVENYRFIGIDDRSHGNDWGYAFRALNGSGISVGGCRGTLLQGNRVVESNLQATTEVQQRHRLGEFTKRNPVKGQLTPQSVWDAGYTDGWTQGSGIIVGGQSDRTQLIGNSIEKAFQGMDLHADHVIASNNVIHDAAVGIKAMHGARNVQIIGNQFTAIDVYAIYLLSGAGSHPAGHREGGAPPMPANVDGGHVIANNIISDYGTGSTGRLLPWGALRAAIRFDDGQKPMNPPVRDVIVTGNVVYNSGRDGVLENGAVKFPEPLYQYAVHVSPGSDKPQGRVAGPTGLHFSNNLFHAGSSGVANVELQP